MKTPCYLRNLQRNGALSFMEHLRADAPHGGHRAGPEGDHGVSTRAAPQWQHLRRTPLRRNPEGSEMEAAASSTLRWRAGYRMPLHDDQTAGGRRLPFPGAGQLICKMAARARGEGSSPPAPGRGQDRGQTPAILHGTTTGGRGVPSEGTPPPPFCSPTAAGWVGRP